MRDQYGAPARTRSEGRSSAWPHAARPLENHHFRGRAASRHADGAHGDGRARNAAAFLAHVKQVLAPTLTPGDIVVMDNLSSHKGDAIRDAIEAAGAELRYLPPYSPDLNPIEQAFAKLKALLRKYAERTVEALRDRIGTLLDHFSPIECRNFFRNAGHA